VGWLGLDCGNVPSWFSALSFSATALIIWRDRKHRLRRQIEDVGVWVKLEISDDDTQPEAGVKFRMTPTVWVRNAANLPVEIVSVRYIVRYQWWNLADTVNPDRPRLPGGHVECEVRGSVVPPGETQDFKDFPIRLDQKEGYAGLLVGPPYPGNRVNIVGISARDAAGRKWEISPRQDRNPIQVPDVLVPLLDANRALGYTFRALFGEMGNIILRIFSRRR
jgi:hypothetical protein